MPLTLLGTYYAASALYPIASAAYVLSQKSATAGRIETVPPLVFCSLSKRTTHYTIPLYLNTKSGIGIPVGGGDPYHTWDPIYTYSYYITAGKGTRPPRSDQVAHRLKNWRLIGPTDSSNVKERYYTDYDHLKRFGPTVLAEATLPVRETSYLLPTGALVDRHTGILCDAGRPNAMQTIIRRSLFEQRLPLTITVPLVAIGVFLVSKGMEY